MKQKSLLWAQIASFFASSFSLALAGLTNDATGAGKAGTVIIGIVFWLGLAGGIALSALLSKQRKAAGFNKGKIGVLDFFCNKPAMVFDCLGVVTFITSVVFLALKSHLFIGFVSIALFFFSFEMHCVLNGKNYKYITSYVED